MRPDGVSSSGFHFLTGKPTPAEFINLLHLMKMIFFIHMSYIQIYIIDCVCPSGWPSSVSFCSSVMYINLNSFSH